MKGDKPKCEDIGFEHLWEVEQIYATTVYSVLDGATRRCKNCNKTQRVKLVKGDMQWVDVEG